MMMPSSALRLQDDDATATARRSTLADTRSEIADAVQELVVLVLIIAGGDRRQTVLLVPAQRQEIEGFSAGRHISHNTLCTNN